MFSNYKVGQESPLVDSQAFEITFDEDGNSKDMIVKDPEDDDLVVFNYNTMNTENTYDTLPGTTVPHLQAFPAAPRKQVASRWVETNNTGHVANQSGAVFDSKAAPVQSVASVSGHVVPVLVPGHLYDGHISQKPSILGYPSNMPARPPSRGLQMVNPQFSKAVLVNHPPPTKYPSKSRLSDKSEDFRVKKSQGRHHNQCVVITVILILLAIGGIVATCVVLIRQ